MGKRKIGEIYNKPIVTGDKNLVTKNEVHESSLGGSNCGGGSSNLLPTLNEFTNKYKYIYVWKTEVRSSGSRIWLEKAIYKVSNIDGTNTLFIENNKTDEQIINLIFRDKEINIEDSQLDINACPNLYLEAGDDIKFAIIIELTLQKYIIVTIPIIEINDINSI